jgi:hypothetical protein
MEQSKKICEWNETERRRSLHARWAEESEREKKKRIGSIIDCNMNFD